MLHALLLVLATAFPSKSLTSWMRPEAFHLSVGMSRAVAVQTLEKHGWQAKVTKEENQLVVDYGGDKAITLEFNGNHLRGIRFEYVATLDVVRKAYEEERARLENEHGRARLSKSKKIAMYENVLPNVFLVLTDDPKSENGQKGFGLLAVRYFDPALPR